MSAFGGKTDIDRTREQANRGKVVQKFFWDMLKPRQFEISPQRADNKIRERLWKQE
jgi:hypothetical protein